MRFIIIYYLFLNVYYYIYKCCSQIYERKELRELTFDELNRFVLATKAIQNTTIGNSSLTIYDSFAKIHIEAEEVAHGNSRFLPWHRYFIREYEKELQKVDASVHLPYWDWSKDYIDPANSIILSNQYMGGNGNKSNNNCVDNGKFSKMILNYPEKHCLQRKYDLNETLSSFAAPSLLNTYLNYNEYSNFCFDLERKHGDPHDLIGGDYDFYQMYSPNDPLFMLHHTFIDLLWYEWQQRHPNSIQYEGNTYNITSNQNDSLITWQKDIKSTFNTKNIGYCYFYKRYQPKLIIKNNNIIKPPFNTFNTSNNSQLQSLNPNINSSKQQANQTISPKSLGYKRNKPTTIDNTEIQTLLNYINNLNIDQVINLLNNELPIILENTIQPKTNIPAIVKSKAISDRWIKMSRLNLTKVKENEAKDNKFIDLINSIPNIKLLL